MMGGTPDETTLRSVSTRNRDEGRETDSMARIVFRRSRFRDESASRGQTGTAWSETIAAGGASSVAVAAAAVCRAKQEGDGSWRPINAISHILWGSGAAEQQQFTMRYTASGLLLNLVACGFWAWLFSLWPRRRRPSLLQSAGRALGISAVAYVTDYHLVPRRFTPGFELCLSRRSFPWIYGALAVGLLFPDALTTMRRRMHHNPRMS
jgi:hypothetical protein